MKQFEKILAEFAMKYKPMLHVPGETSKNKRLFFFDSIVAIPSFMAAVNTTKSPCMGYEFPLNGEIKGGKVLPIYTVYFFVKQEEKRVTGKELSAEVNREALDHAFKFIAWLRNKQETNKDLANINLENLSFRTYGPLMNGWYGVFLQFNDVDKFESCMNPNDFIE